MSSRWIFSACHSSANDQTMRRIIAAAGHIMAVSLLQQLLFLLLILVSYITIVHSFAFLPSSRPVLVPTSRSAACRTTGTIRITTRPAPALVVLSLSSNDKDTSDSAPDEDGVELAAAFSAFTDSKGISLSKDDLLNEEEPDPDDELDERVDEVYSDVEKLKSEFVEDESSDNDNNNSANITNDDIYSSVKERVLDTAGGFVQLVGGPVEEDEEILEEIKPKVYKPPTTVPDSGLTAGEVVELVLTALLNNDNPTKDRGLEILFGYSSPNSQIKQEVGLTPQEYGEFLKETEYKVLFDHEEIIVEKGDFSFDGLKAFFTARLRTGPRPVDTIPVNFILSTKGQSDDDVWLIDSMLIRPQAMRRRRRK